MTILLQSQTVRPNESASFDFHDRLDGFVVGLSHVALSFGDDDHHVRTMAVSLSVNQSGPSQIVVTAHATLDDDSGHGIDSNASSISIVCLGAVGGAEASLANRRTIADGGVSQPIPVPTFPAASQSAFLSGFDLSYGSTDHHLERAHAHAGLAMADSGVRISASVDMSDDSGNSASVKTIDAGYEAFAASTGVEARLLANRQTGNEIQVDFDGPLSAAAVLMQSWRVQFQNGNDHHVKTVTAGTSGWSVQQDVVVLNDAQATLRDASGNTQDDDASNVTLIVLGRRA